MNNSNTTANGYKGSEWFTASSSTTGSREWCKSKLQAAFGDKLLKTRELATNAISSDAQIPGGYIAGQTGCASGWEWVDSYCDLLSEVEVYGSRVWGGGWDVGIGNKQFPLFALAPEFIQPATGSSRYTWWLRTIVSSAIFACVAKDGYASSGVASNNFGIRPKWCIG